MSVTELLPALEPLLLPEWVASTVAVLAILGTTAKPLLVVFLQLVVVYGSQERSKRALQALRAIRKEEADDRGKAE